MKGSLICVIVKIDVNDEAGDDKEELEESEKSEKEEEGKGKQRGAYERGSQKSQKLAKKRMGIKRKLPRTSDEKKVNDLPNKRKRRS